jgi:hypothetical protein
MLSNTHWNFLNALSKAIQGQQLTNSGPKGYYIKIILDESSSQITHIEGFRDMFWATHKNDLCISTMQFFDLVQAGYIINARYQGNYYLVDAEIVADVEVHQSSQQNASLSSPQYECDIFMVMPFRKELQHIYKRVVVALGEELKLEVRRGDDGQQGDSIVIKEVIAYLENAKIIIVDCTEIDGKPNGNVYYELGYADALPDKEVILISQTSAEKLPFDVRHRRIIVYEDTTESRTKLKAELRKKLKSILGEN